MQLAKRPVRSSNASKCVPNSAAAVARAAGRHAWRQHGAARQQGDARRGVAVAAQPEGNSDPRYAYSDPVNQFLGNFLPPARDAAAELAHINWDTPKAQGLSLQELAARFTQEFLRREWFVTGDVPPELFSDGFAFKDESVATTGIRSYALGVRKLFDQETSRAELVAVASDAAAGTITAAWRLEGRVSLPLRPRISPFVVVTTLGTDAAGLVCSQVDAFEVPGWRLLAGALLGAWAGPPAAPPVDELRAAARAAGREGVVEGAGAGAGAAARR